MWSALTAAILELSSGMMLMALFPTGPLATRAGPRTLLHPRQRLLGSPAELAASGHCRAALRSPLSRDDSACARGWRLSRLRSRNTRNVQRAVEFEMAADEMAPSAKYEMHVSHGRVELHTGRPRSSSECEHPKSSLRGYSHIGSEALERSGQHSRVVAPHGVGCNSAKAASHRGTKRSARLGGGGPDTPPDSESDAQRYEDRASSGGHTRGGAIHCATRSVGGSTNRIGRGHRMLGKWRWDESFQKVLNTHDDGI